MATETHLSELAADLLKRAKKRGATEADVVVADGDTFDVQVRLSAVDRLTKARETAGVARLHREAVRQRVDFRLLARVIGTGCVGYLLLGFRRRRR